MKMIKATGKAAQIHLVDLHFINRVAIHGNHEKPIREGFFSHYCWAQEESLKDYSDSTAPELRCSGTPSRRPWVGLSGPRWVGAGQS